MITSNNKLDKPYAGWPVSKALAAYLFVTIGVFGIIACVLVTMAAQAEFHRIKQQESRHQVDALGSTLLSYLHARQNILIDHASFPLMTQAVMQSEDNLVNISDFMNTLSLLGKKHQMVLLDFTGDKICATQSSPVFDYTSQAWVTQIVDGDISSYLGIDHDGIEYTWRIAVPVIYNNLPEGVLVAEIPLMHIQDEHDFNSVLAQANLELVYHDKTIASFGNAVDAKWITTTLNKIDLILKLRHDATNINNARNAIMLKTGATLGILTVCVIFFAIILGRYTIALPLDRLRRMTTAITNQTAYEKITTNDYIREINDLSNNFNTMSKKLTLREAALREAKDDLEVQVSVRTGELEQANDHLRMLTNQAKQLADEANNANMAKSEFLANMSHEIRTPMNAILGFSELLETCELEEEYMDYVKTINRSGKSLLCILNDILDFSKIEAGKMTFEEIDFNFKELTNDVCELSKFKLTDKPVEFILHYDEKIQHVLKGDPGRLRQVLTNIISNAAKFTEQGYIELSSRLVRQDKDEVVILISVTDSGIGIDQKSQASIFNPFQQADGSTTRKYGGTGLGLAICKNIIGLMNGELQLESAVGKGSCFYFTIRLKMGHLPAMTDPQHATNGHDLNNISILLVEDDLINQKLAYKILTKAGCHVEIANNGLEAFELVKTENYQLVFMDMQMPVMNGIEATQKIRQAGFLQLPIIALTANAFQGDRQKCTDAGMNDFIAKPLNRNAIIEKIYRWTQESSIHG